MSEIFNAFIRGEREDIKPLPGIREGLEVMIVLAMLELASQTKKTEKVPTIEAVVNKY